MSLTPYDTGERLEPKTWVTSTAGVTKDNTNDFGKVDFDNDSGETLATVWAERNKDGSYTLYVENMDANLKVEAIQ